MRGERSERAEGEQRERDGTLLGSHEKASVPGRFPDSLRLVIQSNSGGESSAKFPIHVRTPSRIVVLRAAVRRRRASHQLGLTNFTRGSSHARARVLRCFSRDCS